ncbi:molybdopterin-dependent oxidoreductase [Halomicroarcula limicola]|uniref:Molybdopterin-dependent oxidoreductase n=1 Tax=Haloarcula limicola TaxID=1429915 RepID=A0A8J8C466_9EURY|nr:assimilatory nitrate reductase NasA [Halomicroarcula limicola]MBV0923774.1 molybdopterin-dependent oxidoreductase [Halomicroarcula limicola]
MTHWKPTTCMRCAVGCGQHQRGVDQGYGVDKVRGDYDHPATAGLSCERGIRETENPDGEWLTEPLIRRGDTLRPTSWEQALGVVAAEFIQAIADDPDSVAVLGSGQQTNEAAYALGKVARGGIGTRHFDANTTLCMASAVRAYYDAFGSDAPPPTYDDIPEAETHVVWGANPAVAHPVLYRWILDSAADADSRLVVVDPVESETAADADQYVAPDPGTDLELARALLARLVGTDRIDRAFVDAYTEGYDELVDSLPDAASAAETAGVSMATVDALADAFADPTLLYWGMGVNQSTNGTDAARMLVNLCLATGNLGPGTGPFSLTGQANSMGARVVSSKETWPGQRPFTDQEHRATVASTWGVPLSRLPASSGPGPVGIVDQINRGNVDVCWTVATNPVAGMPDATNVERSLDDVFLVAQDAFRSETVEHADVVLPAATWGETEGTTMNMERRVSRVTAVSDTVDAVRQDLDIIAALGNRIDEDLFDEPPLDPETVFDEIRSLTEGTVADCSGITYDRLDAELAVRWPAPDEETQGGYRYYEGSESGSTDEGESWSFPTDSGRACFSAATYRGLPEPTDATYPLLLTTGRRAGAYNTGVRTRETASEVPTARIHPETAGQYIDLLDRGRTVVESRRARVTVDLAPDDSVPTGAIWMDVHNPAVNDLTVPAVDPDSNEPNYKQCAVRLASPDAGPTVTQNGLPRTGTLDGD